MNQQLITIILYFSIILTNNRVLSNETANDNTLARGYDPRSFLTSLAGNLMSRGYGTTAAGGSQVISLNLTNLLVLVLLKALIFAAGSLGASHYKGGYYARSLDNDDKLLTDEEILMFLSYLTGSPGDNGCLQNIACQQPEQAKRYIAAGDMVLKIAGMLSLDPDHTYQYVLKEVEQAANVGTNGGDCSVFVCRTTAEPESN